MHIQRSLRTSLKDPEESSGDKWSRSVTEYSKTPMPQISQWPFSRVLDGTRQAWKHRTQTHTGLLSSSYEAGPQISGNGAKGGWPGPK